METNSTIFYTTAQVTEMVELSDQNVRKYVRLLEDRNYEVAKDEHNRRLFSGDDVAILRELIKLAKQPGYTLETAADQLVSTAPNNAVNQQSRVPSVTTSNEFTELLTSVVESMEDMRNEHNELKEKMDLLISKLEQTSSTFEKSLLTHEDKSDENETLTNADEDDSAKTDTESDEVTSDDTADNAGDDVSEDTKEDASADDTEESRDDAVKVTEEETAAYTDASQKFEAEKRQNEQRIDMTTFENNSSEAQTAEENKAKEEKGAFGRFLDFIKGK